MLSLLFGPDGTTLYAGDSLGHVHKIVQGKLQELFKVHSGPVGALAYDYKDSLLLAAGGRTNSKKLKKVRLVQGQDKREEAKVVGSVRLHHSPIALDFYKGRVAVGLKDGSILVIETDGRQKKVMQSHS